VSDNIYRQMLDYLRENGWWKGNMFGPVNKVCILGAYKCVSQYSSYRIANQSLLKEELSELFDVVADNFYERATTDSNGGFDDRPWVPWFNDHKDTTFADVEFVLEKAAIMRDEKVNDA